MNTSPFSNQELAAGLLTELLVRNLQKSLRFYTNFGFKVLRQSGQSVYLSWDKALLLLNAQDDLPASSSHYASIRLVVPNVDDYYQYACRERLPIVKRIGNRPHGVRDFTVGDPDGFGLRFATPVAPPKLQQRWLEKVQNNL